MSLQSKINAWKGIYDQTGIQTHDSAYIGSILTTGNAYYTGVNIYQSTSPDYVIYETKCYAGQGVTPITGTSGGKYLVTSNDGFNWVTTYDSGTEKYTFETDGDLNCLYLGTTPENDYGKAPASGTLTVFDPYSPLIVFKGLNVALDYAATLFGATDANDSIDMTDTYGGVAFGDIMSNSGLYEAGTMNSAVLYTLAFENTSSGVTALEWALDKYLQGLNLGVDITDSFEDIADALEEAESCLSISYYDYAYEYAEDGDVGCGCDCETNDLLLAA